MGRAIEQTAPQKKLLEANPPPQAQFYIHFTITNIPRIIRNIFTATYGPTQLTHSSSRAPPRLTPQAIMQTSELLMIARVSVSFFPASAAVCSQLGERHLGGRAAASCADQVSPCGRVTLPPPFRPPSPPAQYFGSANALSTVRAVSAVLPKVAAAGARAFRTALRQSESGPPVPAGCPASRHRCSGSSARPPHPPPPAAAHGTARGCVNQRWRAQRPRGPRADSWRAVKIA